MSALTGGRARPRLMTTPRAELGRDRLLPEQARPQLPPCRLPTHGWVVVAGGGSPTRGPAPLQRRNPSPPRPRRRGRRARADPPRRASPGARADLGSGSAPPSSALELGRLRALPPSPASSARPSLPTPSSAAAGEPHRPTPPTRSPLASCASAPPWPWARGSQAWRRRADASAGAAAGPGSGARGRRAEPADARRPGVLGPPLLRRTGSSAPCPTAVRAGRTRAARRPGCGSERRAGRRPAHGGAACGGVVAPPPMVGSPVPALVADGRAPRAGAPARPSHAPATARAQHCRRSISSTEWLPGSISRILRS
ncbi:serine/arginine repetitive matrix protein 1-like isoform X1 [Panicum virgatum]|uniref:serine/arginine repetitive matrix protein 1-like isoform X1 n=1 Tax=Panicum virgatum TaxID=38727 RepID=UPI0019D60EE4|nr:serine/arginine repetitive matrix protein 1-like isoform X1 [Panicum virgatum]